MTITLNAQYETGHIAKCEELLQSLLGTTVLLTPSCTAALEMSALLLNIKPGDEIIMSSFTFPSTANAFMLRGGVPVFCDIRPDTLNIDEQQIRALITKKTRAIVPVHYGGVACEMRTIMSIARKHSLAVVEDNAHGLFGECNNKKLGTFGTFGCASFHSTKNFSSGEGGALLVNDPEYLGRAHVIRDKGTNRQQFLNGQVDKYTWVDIGSSYAISEILAEVLYKQLLRWDIVHYKRGEVFWIYRADLKDWAEVQGVQMPYVPSGYFSAYHLFYLILPTAEDRQRLQQHLKAQDIQAYTHFEPLHLSSMNKRHSHCPVTEDISQRLLRLPLHHQLTFEEQKKVIKAVKGFECG